VREKHCSLAEKVRLIKQANRAEVAEISRYVRLGLLATNGGSGSRSNNLAIAFIPLL
jgi:hypothetical protein